MAAPACGGRTGGRQVLARLDPGWPPRPLGCKSPRWVCGESKGIGTPADTARAREGSAPILWVFILHVFRVASFQGERLARSDGRLACLNTLFLRSRERIDARGRANSRKSSATGCTSNTVFWACGSHRRCAMFVACCTVRALCHYLGCDPPSALAIGHREAGVATQRGAYSWSAPHHGAHTRGGIDSIAGLLREQLVARLVSSHSKGDRGGVMKRERHEGGNMGETAIFVAILAQGDCGETIGTAHTSLVAQFCRRDRTLIQACRAAAQRVLAAPWMAMPPR